jgi:5,10-methenyltetrahydromethanopterin hydrogenase
MRQHPTANEAQKLTLHEQRGTTFVVMLVELPKEDLQLFAYHAVQHPALRGATYIRSRDLGTRRGSVKLHEL